jgi:hypothetical protein
MGGEKSFAKLLSFSDYFSGSTEPIENTAYSARRMIGIVLHRKRESC